MISKIAVVTGCFGFIGNHLTVKLLRDGWYVFGIDKHSYVSNFDQVTYISENFPNKYKFIEADISEIKRPELDAALVGANIAHQLVKKISYRRVVSKAIQATMRMGAQGIRVNVAGRLGGAEIARSEKFAEGRIPLHTLRADIDYAEAEALTTYGIIGIKVWIYKGEIFTKEFSQETNKK